MMPDTLKRNAKSWVSALFAAGMVAGSCFANDASFHRSDSGDTSWATSQYWKDGYVGVSGDDIFLTNGVGKATILRLPKSDFTLRSVKGTPGHRLWTPNDDAHNYTLSDGAGFAGWWRFLHANALHLTADAVDEPTVTDVLSLGGVQFYADADTAVVSNLFGAGTVRSCGAGQLKIARSSGYSSLDASAGSLAFGGDAPAADVSIDAVLAKAQCHFDATAANTLTINDGRVTSWASTIGKDKCTRPSSTKYGTLPGPMLVADYQNGQPVLDFGPVLATTGDVDPATTGTAAFTFTRYVYAKAYFIVAADRAELPAFGDYQDIFGDHEDTRWRRRSAGGLYAGRDTSETTGLDAATDEAFVYVNGNRVEPTYALGGTDLKVIALKSRVGEVGTYCPLWSIAWKSGEVAGGLRVGEVIMFNVALTDAEVDAVNRYLMAKWLPPACAAKRQLDTLVLRTGVTNVAVAADTHAMGALVTANAKLTKTGAGTLKTEVLASTTGTALDIDVQGGDIALGAGIPTVGKIAANPLHHFDASDGASFVTNAAGGVTRWNDTRGTDYSAMVPKESYTVGSTVFPCGKPTIEEGTLNGLPVVDLGVHKGSKPSATSSTDFYAKSAGMIISPYQNNMNRVREGFYVVKKTGSNAFPLGGISSYHFHQGDWGVLLNQTYGSPALVGGLWTADGLPIVPYVYNIGTSAFHLMHFAAGEKVEVTTFGIDRGDAYQFGGCKIAEVVLYDRTLSTAERLETELKLLQKWFGKTAHPLTEKVNAVTYSDDAAHTLATERDLDLAQVTAQGAFTKTGAGALTVGSLAGATDIAVVAGSLAVRDPLQVVLAKAAFHVDASDTNSLVFAEDANVGTYVSEWRDVRTNGVYATAFADAYRKPTLVASVCNGLPVVKMGDRTDWGNRKVVSTTGGAAFNWSKKIQVKEAYMAFAQNGGHYPFVLTCSDSYEFHRADDGAFFNTTYAPKFKDEKFWVDLNEVDNSYKYTDKTGKYLVLGIVAKAGTTAAANSFCKDRSGWIGGLSYGEVLVFDQELTSEERLRVRSYLLKKWRNLDLKVADPEYGAVSAAAGASLSLGYANVNTAQLSGEGTIAGNVTLSENGVVTAAFAADGTLTPLTVNGTLTLPTKGKVVVTNETGAKIRPGEYPLIVAPSLMGGTIDWTLDVSEKLSRKAVLRLEKGKLVLKVRAIGMALYVH